MVSDCADINGRYYKERLNTPRKADGSYDFESVEAIDLELFNDHLKRLLAGETVKIPNTISVPDCANTVAVS